ncbi:Cys-tRNA(Pro) deacylase [Thiomicrorhabdus sp. 6S2-11]|uniref:Cys-tRNA(Pro)/Cys-tRNA(Cys) deacylase n=1 Tax=Thiomicrorhabdus marina TaxID=2818442 RepID=A0ABS3Q2M9_9GAMM|nr:Cys-tRNA(Pro) deacylase [Thiomicrorhabdus marina]MBO1926567.1 Cys-tRNA(Pro) deacylase [Thiomicrorhabdus marina]
MTPAINQAKQAKIQFQVHEYQHDPKAASYGEEAADKLGLATKQVFKTLVLSDEHKQMYVAVVPVAYQLNLKSFAKALGIKKVNMADKAQVSKTGYVLGGVSPIGQKRLLPTIIDSSALNFNTIFVSAGRRGLEIELAAADLQQLTRAQFSVINQS